MRRFSCDRCGHDVFFDSLTCVSCDAVLGYEPRQGVMLAAQSAATWQDRDGGRTLYACANRADVSCNFLTEAEGSMCLACRHNRVIPDLSVAGSAALWAKIEAAKRVLFYSLLAFDLPRPTREEDPDGGLVFDFVADDVKPDGTVEPRLTGHDNGLITINIAEGDDAERERRRAMMGEPYRTLVGHFRHEIAHFYWDQLVAPDADRLARCRALFGDDREDYAKALERHYEAGPNDRWRDAHISAYAASHAWEDFAETFAHYVHMVDGLETAAAFGLALNAHEAIADPYASRDVEALLSAWVPTTVAVNAVNRSLGQPDLYPFVLSAPVREKLSFISDLVHRA